MKYVIMGQLSGIGGWQLYIDARSEYISERGHDVYLISIGNKDSIKLTGFLNKNYLCLPEVHMPPASYTKKQINYILNRIYDFLGDDDGTMTIESTDMFLSMWGELIAKHYKSRNFSYLLHSHFPQQNKAIQDFFLFKYNRDELAGMSELTLPELFHNHPCEYEIEPRNLPAEPKDPITNDNSIEELLRRIEQYKKDKKAFVIGYFGNLDKPHFSKLCDYISSYCEFNTSQEYIFLTIGSSGKGIAEKKQLRIETKINNCKVFNIPAMYPVPRQAFCIMDVCLASWGSSVSSARGGALTIRLKDDVTIIPHGVLGITVSDYKSPQTSESLKELLDKIQRGKYRLEDANIDKKPYDYKSTHRKIDDYIFNITHEKEYYDISNIKKVSTRSKIEKILNSVFGIEITNFVLGVIKKILA